MKPYVVKFVPSFTIKGNNIFKSTNHLSGEELSKILEELLSEQTYQNYELLEIKDTYRPNPAGYSQHTGYLLIFKKIDK